MRARYSRSEDVLTKELQQEERQRITAKLKELQNTNRITIEHYSKFMNKKKYSKSLSNAFSNLLKGMTQWAS